MRGDLRSSSISFEVMHSSEERTLCLIKCSSKMVQNDSTILEYENKCMKFFSYSKKCGKFQSNYDGKISSSIELIFLKSVCYVSCASNKSRLKSRWYFFALVVHLQFTLRFFQAHDAKIKDATNNWQFWVKPSSILSRAFLSCTYL